jgi:hypothetical protein
MADRFHVVLFTVVGLTVACGAVACVLAIFTSEPAHPMEQELFKTCSAVFQTGVGAIFGMLTAHAST